MPISFSSVRYEKVEFSDNDFIEVRGLSPSDVATLVAKYKPEATQLYDRFTGRDANTFGGDDVAAVMMDMLSLFPTLFAHLIAIAADAEDQRELIEKLPFDAQLKSVEKIAEVTFRASGGFENFMETVLRLMKELNGLNGRLQRPQV